MRKYVVTSTTTVHDHAPGEVVEPEAHWNVDFLLATGHLTPAEPAPKSKQSDPVEEK
jgi:hypothetical protein